MQPGIIYNYLSILKAEQLALIEGKDLWVVAGTEYFSGLGLANSHFRGATIQLRGKTLWLLDRNQATESDINLLFEGLLIQENANCVRNPSTKKIK